MRPSEGMPIKVIARRIGCSKYSVRGRSVVIRRPKGQSPPRGSLVDAVEPRMPATPGSGVAAVFPAC